MEERIQQRLAELKSERDRLIANVHAYEGAIQELSRWLEEVKNGTGGIQGSSEKGNRQAEEGSILPRPPVPLSEGSAN